jgi:hypothetical protein
MGALGHSSGRKGGKGMGQIRACSRGMHLLAGTPLTLTVNDLHTPHGADFLTVRTTSATL